MSPLDPEGALLREAEHVAVADHPEEAEQDHAARQHSGVQLDTPDTRRHRGTPERQYDYYQDNYYQAKDKSKLYNAKSHIQNEEWGTLSLQSTILWATHTNF